MRGGVAPIDGKHECRTVTLVDLLLNQGSLDGDKVKVPGDLVMVGENAVLRRSDADPSPLFVDIKAVPREQRRRMLQLCGAGCAAEVRGTAGRILGQPGIVAESVDLK